MTPRDLIVGDFVLFSNGDICQILPDSKSTKTKMALYYNAYGYCASLDDFNDDFTNKNTHHYNIYKIIQKTTRHEDYQQVASHFIARTSLSNWEINTIKWVWIRDNKRPEFEKTNLRNGEIAVLRNGKTCAVILDVFMFTYAEDLLISQNEVESLANYNEDLTHKTDHSKDIVKIEVAGDWKKPHINIPTILWERDSKQIGI